MGKPKFIPGPWKVMYSTDPSGKCALAVWPATTEEGTIGSPICKISPEEDETEADKATAQLIAVAPEMYDALKMVNSYFIDLQNKVALSSHDERAWKQVSAILLKINVYE